jgi:NADH dehydrogenase FAD-containing subunit
MMKIAVVGATGPTGIHLVTELRKAVASVRDRAQHRQARATVS